MIDSIGSRTSLTASQRSQSLTQTNSVRNTDVLTTIQQTNKNASNTTTALAVPPSAKTGSSSTTKLPRGSLVDVLA